MAETDIELGHSGAHKKGKRLRMPAIEARKRVSGSVSVTVSCTEVTPIEQRTFARYYEAARLGVTVSAEEGTRHCALVHEKDKRCEWCVEHGMDNHFRLAPEQLHLCVLVTGEEGSIGEINGPLSSAQLTTLIESLTLVRDTMIADGALSSS